MFVSTHSPPHIVSPDEHVLRPVHTPAAQKPERQVLAQPPQFFGSFFVSTHDESQRVVPPPHVITHAPAVHDFPLVQALAHAPQFPGSTERSTHLLPHFVVPPVQRRRQEPPTQTSSTPQTFPQPPQFVPLVTGQAVLAPPGVAVGLADPAAEGF